MALTLNQAAKTCGRSKSTLLEAIRSGRMSAPKDDRGRYAIDPSELHRAFPFKAQDWSTNQFSEPKPNNPENHLASQSNQVLEREVELLREMLARAEANAEHWRSLVDRQQALLEDKRYKDSRRFFQRLFKR